MIKIKVKLFALLGQYLPEGSRNYETEIEADGGATPVSVLEGLGVPSGQCHLVLVNGVYIAPSERAGKTLREGDAIAVWPPVAGG